MADFLDKHRAAAYHVPCHRSRSRRRGETVLSSLHWGSEMGTESRLRLGLLIRGARLFLAACVFSIIALSALPATAARVTGLVADAPEGTPVAGAKVSLQTYDDNGAMLEWCEGVTNEKGEFAMDSRLCQFGHGGSVGSMLGDLAGALFKRGMAESERGGGGSGVRTQLPSLGRLDCHNYYMWVGIPVAGYEEMHLFTQMFHVRVEKEGYKPYDDWQMPYDYMPTFRMGVWGKKEGAAKLDTVTLVKQAEEGESAAPQLHLTLSELEAAPTEVSAGAAVSISVKQTPAPDQKKVGGTVIAVTQAAAGCLRVDLRDDGKGPDKTAGDNVFAGEMTLTANAFPPGKYTLYVLATGKPFGTRTMHTDKPWWRSKSPELASRNILTAEITVQ